MGPGWNVRFLRSQHEHPRRALAYFCPDLLFLTSTTLIFHMYVDVYICMYVDVCVCGCVCYVYVRGCVTLQLSHMV